jgi:hypothetical protein
MMKGKKYAICFSKVVMHGVSNLHFLFSHNNNVQGQESTVPV